MARKINRPSISLLVLPMSQSMLKSEEKRRCLQTDPESNLEKSFNQSLTIFTRRIYCSTTPHRAGKANFGMVMLLDQMYRRLW
jgi:hypothetical protein